MTISPNRSLADVGPESALLWADFKTQFDVNGVRKCNNLATAPGAPKLLTMGDGTTANTFPAQLVGRHGVSLAGAQWIDTGIVDPFERTDRFTLFVMFEATAFNSDLISSCDDAQSLKGILLQNTTLAYSRFYLNNTYSSNLLAATTNVADKSRATRTLAATYGGTSSLGGINLYIGGAATPVSQVHNSLSASIKSGKSFLIGARRNGTGFSSQFVGNIHSAAMLPWELTPQQVQYLHRQCMLDINAA